MGTAQAVSGTDETGWLFPHHVRNRHGIAQKETARIARDGSGRPTQTFGMR
jgi:hypothetical protein